MHPIVIYELVKTRTELDRRAERARLARSEMPLMQHAYAGLRRPGARPRPGDSARPGLGSPGIDPTGAERGGGRYPRLNEHRVPFGGVRGGGPIRRRASPQPVITITAKEGS